MDQYTYYEVLNSIGCINYSFSEDYYEKSALVVFLLGCNIRCRYCYNWKIVLGEPLMGIDIIETFINRNIKFMDAVVLSGGEPTIYSFNFLKNLILIFKNKKDDILIKIDTNGINPNIINKLMMEKLIDAIAIDIKAPLTFHYYSKILMPQYEKFITEIIDRIKDTITITRYYATNLDLIEFRTVRQPWLSDMEIEMILEDLNSLGFNFNKNNFFTSENMYRIKVDGTKAIYRLSDLLTDNMLENNI